MNKHDVTILDHRLQDLETELAASRRMYKRLVAEPSLYEQIAKVELLHNYSWTLRYRNERFLESLEEALERLQEEYRREEESDDWARDRLREGENDE